MNFTRWIIVQLVVFNIGVFTLLSKPHEHIDQPSPQIVEPIPPQPQPKPELNPKITTPFPAYLNYQLTVDQLKKWNSEAPEMTEVGTYGKSKRGTDIYYIRINHPHHADKKKTLVTACIHGNEPLSASTVMCYIGTILDKYGEDKEVTDLVNSRDLYFVPVISPDSYPNSREVDGVDPNRNFPTQRDPNKQSVPPIQAVRDFFLKIKPDAVISGHTYGRVYLTPWGDQNQVCSNESDYQRIMSQMASMSNYRVQRACQMYNRPIYGGEVDWYYRNGSMAIVMEFGLHQQIPSESDIRTEFDRTFKAVLFYLKEAPQVEVKSVFYRRAA